MSSERNNVTITEAYYLLCQEGGWAPDSAQQSVLPHLEQIYTLVHTPPCRPSFLQRLLGQKPPCPHPLGLYLWGGVGRGKTMLMDLFYDQVSVKKKRLHYHEFMEEVHRSLPLNADVEGPIQGMCQNLLSETQLLCLDELSIKDIGDAMILARLFNEAIERRIFLVITSNQAPDDLYSNGLHREYFLPTIDLLKTHLSVVMINSEKDYRLAQGPAKKKFFFPLAPETKEDFEDLFRESSHGQPLLPRQLSLWGRFLEIPRCYGFESACMTFQDLCGDSLAASDYLAIGRAFKTLFIDEIPHLNLCSRDEIRRFVLLVDVLYDNQIPLVMRAASPLDTLYDGDSWNTEYQRTYSRLVEMQTW